MIMGIMARLITGIAHVRSIMDEVKWIDTKIIWYDHLINMKLGLTQYKDTQISTLEYITSWDELSSHQAETVSLN